MTNIPVIKIEGQIGSLIDEAERVLLEHHRRLGVFQRDGKLIWIGAVKRENGEKPQLSIIPLVKENVIELLSSIIQFQKFDGRGKEWKDCNCPEQIATTYLARIGRHRKMPVLKSIITAPTIRADGTILDQRGYDYETSLFFEPQGVEFPSVPESPTKDDARAALDYILSFVSEIPFVVHEDNGKVSQAVFLSGFLSTIIRHRLRAVPLTAFNAPTAGSGKSILIEAISNVTTGKPTHKLTQAGEEETEKRLSAALQAGAAIICLDNCTEPLTGSLLAQAITEKQLSVRTLGKSENKQITNDATYFANGNNLGVAGDMTRRVIMSNLDAGCERPEDREFKTIQPDEAMLEHRAELIVAALTIFRAFHLAGKPKMSKPPGSFADWSTNVRDCLIWLGEADPWLSVTEIREQDPQRDQDIAALNMLFNHFGVKKQVLKDVVEYANKRSDMAGHYNELVHRDLWDALKVVTDNELNSLKLGHWLRRVKDRHLGGFMVTQAGKLDGNQRWSVKKLTPAVPVGDAPAGNQDCVSAKQPRPGDIFI